MTPSLEARVPSAAVDPVTTGWWGEGPPPTERWLGVTIPIDTCGGRYHFDATLADRVCVFFPRYCSHSKGEFAGTSFHPLDYQTQLILRPLFGWVGPDGLRRFRKAFIEIPKKNGKTQLIAGLALYMLLGDVEPGAEVYVAAADREQARVLFSAAKSMVERHPALSRRLTVFRNQIVRNDDPTAFFQVLSAEAASKHGPNIHCLIIDELHAQSDRELFEALTRGVIARRQPLIVLITTAGDDTESICYEEYDYAKRVLSGTIPDERHLPVIFEAQPNEDWADPAVLTRVNPGVGTTIKLEALLEAAQQAKNEPRKRNDFLRYHTNRWTNQATAWIPIEWWDACHGPIDDAELVTLDCGAGLDLAQKWDLACFHVVFRKYLEAPVSLEVVTEETNGAIVKKTIALNYQLFCRPYFWIPENTMRQHEKQDGVPYGMWSETCSPGTDWPLVSVTDGDIIDYTRIYQDITTKILPRYPRLKQGTIGYDPAFATDIATKLRDLAGLQILEVLQNYKMLSEPAQIVEALIKGKRVRHDGHRVLRWNWENASIKTDDAGRIRPVKPKNSSKRIDGAVAMLMADKVLSMAQKPPEFAMFFAGGRK
jgi:phage terminase large subunit-like protein